MLKVPHQPLVAHPEVFPDPIAKSHHRLSSLFAFLPESNTLIQLKYIELKIILNEIRPTDGT